MQKIEITREQIQEVLRSWPDGRDQDPRVQVLLDIASEYKTYTEKLEWLARNLAEAVEKNQAQGLGAVSETLLQTSLIPDVTCHAAKLTALLNVLDSTRRAPDDPEATVVDELIQTLKSW
jgi:hypothetical protein